MLQAEIIQNLKKAIKKLETKEEVEIFLEAPREESHGDYACNITMSLAKKLGKNPRELAEKIIKNLPKSDLLEKVEIAGPGFINFTVSEKFYFDSLAEILKKKEDYGRSDFGKGKKTMVEFISANPTGPLTIANGRGGYGGDVLTNVLDFTGHQVSREYYVNDAGNQVLSLGKSAQAAIGKIPDSEEYYQGEYVKEWAEEHRDHIYDEEPVETAEKFSEYILEEKIKVATGLMGIYFDNWFSEKTLHESKAIEKAIEHLQKQDLIYVKEGALWCKTTSFGDDKDRVLKKADGEYTYFAADIAYHQDKFNRGFEKCINIWGADHHGYVERMKAGVEALGYSRDQLDIIITQMVRLVKNGKDYKMSKRKGNFILVEDLLQEIKPDVVRFFFVMRAWNTHLDFDLDLAQEESEKNPVFYVQYAHARLCSILHKAKGMARKTKFELQDYPLHKSEKSLIKEFLRFPDLLQEISKNYEIHKLPFYATELATRFHKFYNDCHVIDEKNPELTTFRLDLVKATKFVLGNVLKVIGISAPEKM